jgi:hypothetical protein
MAKSTSTALVLPFPNVFSKPHDTSCSNENAIPPLSCRVENGVFDDELTSDIETLSLMQLRKKYETEANTHRSRKNECKKNGAVFAPEFFDFIDFLWHAGKCPKKGFTLHRIDNANLDYAPHLCRWASKKEQNNAKGDTIILTIDGVSKPLTEWAEITGQLPDTLRRRRRLGWADREIVYGRNAPARSHAYHADWDLLLPAQHMRLAEPFDRDFLRDAKSSLFPLKPHQDARSHRVVWVQTVAMWQLRIIAKRYDVIEHDHHFNGGPECDPLLDRLTAMWWDVLRHLRENGYSVRYPRPLFRSIDGVTGEAS